MHFDWTGWGVNSFPVSPSSIFFLGVIQSRVILEEGDHSDSLVASPALVFSAAGPVSKPSCFSAAPLLSVHRSTDVLRLFKLICTWYFLCMFITICMASSWLVCWCPTYIFPCGDSMKLPDTRLPLVSSLYFFGFHQVYPFFLVVVVSWSQSYAECCHLNVQR